MSKKGTITTCDYIDFDICQNRSLRIIRYDKKYKMGFLILLGINTGLRISDLLKLKHKDIRKGVLELKEKKTNKYRKITINENINSGYKLFITRSEKQPKDDDYLFVSQKNSVFSIRSVNRDLKNILSSKEKLNISSHTLRKTFGRRVFQNNQESEKSLIFLSDMFNHSNIAVTRRYLGIRAEELSDIYINL